MRWLRSRGILALCASVGALAAPSACSNSSSATPASGTDGGVDSGGGSGDDATTDTGSSSADTGTDTGTAAETSTGTDGGKRASVLVRPYGDAGTTTGTGSFSQTDGPEGGTQVTLTLDVTSAVPGSRGVHVHVGTSCDVGAPGAHFNPGPTPLNGQWDNIQVDDAGVGHLLSPMTAGGAPGNGLSLDPYSDGGPGIVGRVLIVHGAPVLSADGGPTLTEAGTVAPPPISGCGIITSP
jgi:hypothetical protein